MKELKFTIDATEHESLDTGNTTYFSGKYVVTFPDDTIRVFEEPEGSNDRCDPACMDVQDAIIHRIALECGLKPEKDFNIYSEYDQLFDTLIDSMDLQVPSDKETATFTVIAKPITNEDDMQAVYDSIKTIE